jgi:hypothetical protein
VPDVHPDSAVDALCQLYEQVGASDMRVNVIDLLMKRFKLEKKSGQLKEDKLQKLRKCILAKIPTPRVRHLPLPSATLSPSLPLVPVICDAHTTALRVLYTDQEKELRQRIPVAVPDSSAKYASDEEIANLQADVDAKLAVDGYFSRPPLPDYKNNI